MPALSPAQLKNFCHQEARSWHHNKHGNHDDGDEENERALNYHFPHSQYLFSYNQMRIIKHDTAKSLHKKSDSAMKVITQAGLTTPITEIAEALILQQKTQ